MYIYIHIYIKEQDRNFYSSTILQERLEHQGRNKTINFAKWGPIIFLLTKNIDKKINTIIIQAIHLYAAPFVYHFIIISLPSLPPAPPTSVSSSALSGCVVLYLQGQSQPFLNGEGGEGAKIFQFVFIPYKGEMGKHYCRVKECKNNSDNKDISFHSFPKDKLTLDAWVKVTTLF